MKSHFKQEKPKKVPFKKALLWIFLSTLLISGSTSAGLFYYQSLKNQRAHEEKNNIIAIVQTSSEKESLKTAYLAELLNLSYDQPKNLYSFNLKEAKQKLLSSSVIKKAEIFKVNPGTLYINYKLRTPLAYLIDFSNAAIDEEGAIFPFHPFFTPKKLPEFYLGLSESENGENLTQNKNFSLALKLLNILLTQYEVELSDIIRIDVSKAYAPSYGQREIVIILNGHIERLIEGKIITSDYQRFLRLSPDEYMQSLANYLVLEEALSLQEKGEKALVIDLRTPCCAFYWDTSSL